jgi:hypothetical protein
MKSGITSFSIISLILLILSGCHADNQKHAANVKVGSQPDGSILVPTNQLLRPAGFQVNLPGRPVDLILTPDQKFLVVKNRQDLVLIRLNDRTVMQSLPYPGAGASFTGICISPDGSRIFVTDAENRLCIAKRDKNNILQWDDTIVLPGRQLEGLLLPEALPLMKKVTEYMSRSAGTTHWL